MEATSGMLAGVILPGKKFPGVVNRIETVLKAEKNWEVARNKAMNIVDDLGTDSNSVIGQLEVSAGNEKVVSRKSSDGKLGSVLIMTQRKGRTLVYRIIRKANNLVKQLKQSYLFKVMKRLLKLY